VPVAIARVRAWSGSVREQTRSQMRRRLRTDAQGAGEPINRSERTGAVQRAAASPPVCRELELRPPDPGGLPTRLDAGHPQGPTLRSGEIRDRSGQGADRVSGG